MPAHHTDHEQLCPLTLRVAGALLASVAAFTGAARGADEPQVGPAPGGGYVASTLQLIRPAGESVEFPSRPTDLALSPDGKTLYAKDDRGLVVIDIATWKVRQRLTFLVGGGSLHGIAVSGDGSHVYLSTADDGLWVGDVGADGNVRLTKRILVRGTHNPHASHGCGIALTADGNALVRLSLNNTLGVVDLGAGKLVKEIRVGAAPYGIALSPDGATAYVSDWGGRAARAGEATAKSAGTDIVVDKRGIAASGCVSVVDLRAQREVAQVETGLHPSDVRLTADGKTLYVANANSDTVSVIDVAARAVTETIPVRPDPALPFGSASNALALSTDGRTLYVANGGNNAVAVVALKGDGREKSEVRGFIPAGWYPSAVLATHDGLFVANLKGVGSRGPGTKAGAWNVKQYLGTVSRLAAPRAQELEAFTKQVLADARVPQSLRAWEKAQAGVPPVPVPAHVGEPSVFEHVVYVIKENRTYDQVLGDMPRGNSDASLCVFGRDVTPNHHALATQFVLLDNFYCNGVISADGHAWATEGNVSDAFEKSFGGFTRVYFEGDPLTASSSGFIWDAVLLHGLSFRNYGEKWFPRTDPPTLPWGDVYDDWATKRNRVHFTYRSSLPPLVPYTCPDYPGWHLNIPDALRADVFLREFKRFEEHGDFPNFVLVYLPSDHTHGTTPGWPTPRAMAADNDLALGRIVDAISHSKFWPKTCVFAIEDDPQAGFDHVDGHRSLCLVASPYTKRGQTISAFYNQTSVLHTMEVMMGLPPMNQMDAMAPLMTECFTATADPRPYAAAEPQVALNEMNPTKAARAGDGPDAAATAIARQNFEAPDRADEDVLNRDIWRSVKGPDAPYPRQFAGAHGKGLGTRHLKLVGRRGGDGDDDD